MIQFCFLFVDGNLHVRYRSVSGIWEGVLTGLESDVWYTIDLSWDNENGMTVYVNNEQRSWSQVCRIIHHY